MNRLNVFYNGYGEHTLVGQLILDNHQPIFQYANSWLNKPLPLSPLEVPASSQLYYGYESSQHGLPGFIADCLPDGWGMLLMDRFFRKYQQREKHEINVLERLAYIGSTSIGALSFEPEEDLSQRQEALSLFSLAQASQAVIEGVDTDVLKSLMIVGGSPQGARPKAMVKYDRQTNNISNLFTAQGEDWLVKFPARNEDKSVCALEQVYAEMARQSGLNMPDSRFFDLGEEYGAFGVQRFDRINSLRVHTHTLAGLLNTDFRIPSLSYLQFLRCIRALTHSEPEVLRGFQQCVFNVMFNNRDDHTKNFSFLMDQYGTWRLSPSYDLSFNMGLNGEHNMDIMGDGRHPTRQHLLELANASDINQKKAKDIIERILGVASTLPEHLQKYPIIKELRSQVTLQVTKNMKLIQF